MRKALAPMLFDDEDPTAAAALRASIVQPATRSPRARTKAASKHSEDGLPVHSFRTLLADLATLTKNTIRPRASDLPAFDRTTKPTAVQQRAFDLLGVPIMP